MSPRQNEFTPLVKATLFFQRIHNGFDYFTHSLQTGLLPSATGCALFINSQVILKSMFLRFRSQTYFESSVSFSYRPPLKYFFIISISDSGLSWA